MKCQGYTSKHDGNGARTEPGKADREANGVHGRVPSDL